MAELRARNTWKLLEKPEGVKILSSKIVLKLKRHSGGSLEKFKALLVILGCFQDKATPITYAPVVDYTTVRVTLFITALNKCQFYQLDVTGAFLHGDLNNPVYVYQPRGYEEHGKEALVCKLNRIIYGLKQAPRVWYQYFADYLEQSGFKRLNNSNFVFKTETFNEVAYIFLYVDDMLLISRREKLISFLNRILSEKVKVNNLRKVKDFLGVNISQNNREFLLSQKHYVAKILAIPNISSCKPTSTPLDPA